ncbi:hypothetical protein [Roseomonas sp. BN140053]|uniref:hypothetical protein n=1 Tax=Roseomonas sp. BN140053 TaxID=3391898 RepID=UPI0039E761AC
MDIADSLLLRVATEAGRTALLDQESLGQLAGSAFDLSLDPLSGPFALALDSAQIGVEAAPPLLLEGMWRAGDAPVATELRLALRGLRAASPARAEALWRGELIARRIPADSVVEGVRPRFALLDLDRSLAAAPGGLPADADALEAARRGELLARLKTGMEQPELLDEAALDDLLRAAGQDSVAGLLAARGSTALGTLRVTFSAPAAGPPVPVRLPVTVAVFLRETLSPLAPLLAEIRAVREALGRDPDVLPPPAPLRRRAAIAALVVTPAALFDAPGWPGGDATARRAAAVEFLAREGVALAVAPP